MINYDNDLKALHDIITIVFTNHIEPQLLKMHVKYREQMFINATSNTEFSELIKTHTLTVRSYLSNSYYKYVLRNYFSDTGLIFLIMTELSLKAKLTYSELLNRT